MGQICLLTSSLTLKCHVGSSVDKRTLQNLQVIGNHPHFSLTFKSLDEFATDHNKSRGGAAGSPVMCCWGSGLVVCAEVQDPDAERTWGPLESLAVASAFRAGEGAKLENSQNGRGADGKEVLFLVLLLCILLGYLSRWRLAKEIHRVSGVLERRDPEPTVLLIQSGARQRRFQVRTLPSWWGWALCLPSWSEGWRAGGG